MHDLLKPYAKILPFLGKAIGENIEIALHDLSLEGMPIVAIYNGEMSHRKVGDSHTVLGEHILQTKQYETKEYVTNYKSMSSSGKILRSSSYFIKDEKNELVGMFCINVDISDYDYLNATIQKILGIQDHEDVEYKRENPIEVLSNSLESTVSQCIQEALKDMACPNYLEHGRLNAEEKMTIIRALHKQGIFNVKGAIPVVAKELASSEPTIYRYLKKI